MYQCQLFAGSLLCSGVFDQHGCPLIIFPADGQDRLLELGKAEVVDFIHYFHALVTYVVFRLKHDDLEIDCAD